MNRRSLLLSLLLFSLPAVAQAARQEVSVSIGVWDSEGLESGAAVGASWRRFWRGAFSARLGGLLARSSEATTAAVQLRGELHPFRASRISPWIGAGAAVVYSHIGPPNEHFHGSETDLAPIFSGGMDVAVSPRVSVGAEVSYLNYEVTIGSRSGIAVDPLLVMVVAQYQIPRDWGLRIED